jgi:hypothetical protein
MIPFPELEKIVEPVAPGSASGAGPAWWWWLLAALLAALALVAALTLLGRIVHRFRFPAIPHDPAREAIRQLEALQRHAASSPTPETAAAVATTVRHYLDRLSGIMARYTTTEEMMGHSRRPAPPPTPAVAACEAVLSQCDQILFGNSSAQPETLINSALSAIRASQSAAAVSPHPPHQPPPLPHAPPA